MYLDNLDNIYLPFLVVAACICWFYLVPKGRAPLPLPPGPKALPLIGNLLDVPQTRPWVTYRDWAKAYGSDMIFMRLFSQPTVVLCSAKAAFDLLEKRSNIYSDRPQVIMDELTGWDWNFAFISYGQRWRSRRRCFHQHFNQNAVDAYYPVQNREVLAFLRRALESPGDVDIQSINLTLAAIIVDITYGIRITDMNDRYIHLARQSVEAINESRKPGAFWLDYFPILKYVPAWVPGAAGKKLGRMYKPIVEEVRDRAFDAVKNDVANRTAPSVAQRCITDLEDKFLETDEYTTQEQIARDVLGLAYSAAVDTQFSSITSFILAMATYPEVQRKAQQELDDVIGSKRLPDHSDRDALPYTHAVVLETFRWMPVVPLGIPHRVMVDDEYNGHRIPKGSMILANAWAMLHDPEEYPNPEAFNPDRFIKNGDLNPDVRNPYTIAFGFGRRICPGRHLANDSLFLWMASILHVFNVELARDAEGRFVTTQPEPTTGFVSYPSSLPCVLKPRSSTTERLVCNLESL